MIGRDDEVERICGFLDASAPDGPRALVLDGQAGIGKSTIWLKGLDVDRFGWTLLLPGRSMQASTSAARSLKVRPSLAISASGLGRRR